MPSASPDPRPYLGAAYLDGFEETVRIVHRWIAHNV
jgi:hypothetical protein